MIKEHIRYSLLPHNTFGIDVKADLFLEYSSVEELKSILSRDNINVKPFLHIGKGSNLLFVSDFKGTILHSCIKGVQVVEETDDYVTIRVGAGEVWDDIVGFCVERGWSGMENLSLIPGEVGATAVQNIGAYGAEVKDVIDRVETIEVASLRERVFLNEDCHFSYRRSIFKNELKGQYIVTYVTYKLDKHAGYNLEYGNLRSELEKAGDINLDNIRRTVIAIRQSKLPDPEVEGNAGSFFMNPVVQEKQFEAIHEQYPEIPHYKTDNGCVKIPAAWMIDRCGWKGRRLGNAGVHDKQALVLVNKGGATGKEIINLSHAIQDSVRDKFGVDIYPEVNFIGE